ncbi:transketolase C-terminal domain-containing protein [Hyphomicrobium sp.]|uniref:transketolase C-terminal domain-containing protein n=1 Tax=Hyphomicrobium sp. TaxID=82 RepID=UPI003F7204B0
MPPVTPSMVHGKISRWHVAEGQAVAAGDVLVEIATSTATLEIEAEDGGRVERILVPAGTEGVKVNTPIAVVLADARRRDALPLAFAALDPLPGPRADTLAAAAPIPAPRARTRGAGHGAGADQTYREALRDALAEDMRADDRVLLIGVDVAQNRGALKVAQGLEDEFGPSRVVTVPALDEALFGLAVGAAMAGLKPVVEVASWGRALDVMLPYLAEATEAFYLSGGTLPVSIVFRGPNGFTPGATGQDARCVAATLAQIPGLTVVQPATASAARGLLSAAIRSSGPVAVLEHDLLYASRELYVAAPSEVHAFALGKARIARAGSDVTIAASGHAVLAAIEAAHRLSDEGIDAEVIDLMSVRPLDIDRVAGSVSKTGRLVTIEEGWGIGAELTAAIVSRCFGALKGPPVQLSGMQVPLPYAQELQGVALPDADALTRAVRAAVRGGP